MFFDNLYNQVGVFSKEKIRVKLQILPNKWFDMPGLDEVQIRLKSSKKTIKWSSYEGSMKDDLVMPGDEGRGKRRYCCG